MRRHIRVLLCCATALPAVLARADAGDGLDRFRNAMASLAAHKSLSRQRTGIEIISLRDDAVVYSYNAHKPLVPASNMKIVAGIVALQSLGPDFRFRTTVRARSEAVNRKAATVAGDLYLVGSGDPTLCTADLKEMAASLRAAGVTEVTGDVVADSSCFADRGFWRNWEQRHRGKRYAPEISGLTLNWNGIEIVVAPAAKIGAPAMVRSIPRTAYVTIEGRVTTAPGSRTARLSITVRDNAVTASGRLSKSHAPVTVRRLIHDPDLYAAQVFKEALEAHGISVEGGVRREKAPNGAITLAAHESAPLQDIVTPMMKHSANLTAENLLRAASIPIAGQGSVHASAALALQILERAGADTDEVRIADASGLSGKNRLSADALARLLRYAWRADIHPDVLVGALPVAGVDGTLSNRCRANGARNAVCAKTGTLSGACTLSGYAATADGDLLCFSFLMNDFSGGAAKVRSIQDRMCSLMAALRR